jgi:uncharacterized protein RhaS with RHS repeats
MEQFYRARYYDPSIGRFSREDPYRFRAGVNFYPYVLNNPANWIDPLGLEVRECRRPVAAPGAGDTPHTFLYSTTAGKGFGLGPASGARGAVATLGISVKGKIEFESPYETSGKMKPKYECSTVSTDTCFENCVNRKANEAAANPPDYRIGKKHYQCDDWVSDIERACAKECKK